MAERGINADRLVEALEQAATREDDPERRGWLKKTATYLGSAGRDLAVEIGASAISRQMVAVCNICCSVSQRVSCHAAARAVGTVELTQAMPG